MRRNIMSIVIERDKNFSKEIARDNLDLVKFYFENGGDINSKIGEFTIAKTAIIYGAIEIFRFLAENNADISDPKFPFYAITQKYHLYSGKGVYNPERRLNFLKTIQNFEGLDLKYFIADGTYLHWAMSRCPFDEGMVNYLIELGADKEIINSKNEKPIDWQKQITFYSTLWCFK